MGRHRTLRGLGISLLVGGLMVLVGPPVEEVPSAMAAGSAPAGTIYVIRTSAPTDVISVRPDGGGVAATGCSGDRTMAATPRRVLVMETTGATFPAYLEFGVMGSIALRRLVSTDDRCSDRLVLAELPMGSAVSAASWSLDGRRIATALARYDSSGQLLDQGIWVGEVDGSCGSRLCGFHLAVRLPMTVAASGPGGLVAYRDYLPARLRWSPDGRRVTYDRDLDAYPDQVGIFVADLGAPGSAVVRTDDAVLVAGGSAYQPAFSPVPGDDRIAYVQQTARKGCARNDIFITSSSGGASTRVGTSSSGMCQLGYPDWSPDAQWLVFDAWSGAVADSQAVYRFRADGSGKVVAVLADRGATYHAPTWRR